MPEKQNQNKTGSAGRFGPRYGTKARERIRDVEEGMKKDHRCPECEGNNVNRVGSGIWKCNRCGTKFAAKAYRPTVTPVKTETSKGESDEE